MRKITLSTNVTVFLLSFGISLLDAVQSHDWLRALPWFAIGLVFLRANSLKTGGKHDPSSEMPSERAP